MKSIATLQLVILAVLSSPVIDQGEKVIVQVEHPKSDGNLDCVLPLTLKVKVERQGGKREIPEIFLSKSNVISPTRNVKIMEMDTAGYVRTHHHEIQELEVLKTQAYHNHSVGACFIVCCVLTDTGRMYFRLEGSIYLNQSKYRLTPELAGEEGDRIQFESQHVAVTYSMTPVWEFTFYDLGGVENFGKNLDGSSVKDRPAGMTGDVEQPARLSDSDTREPDLDGPSGSGSPRYRRDTATYYIDILPVVDYSTFSLWYERYQDVDKIKTLLNSYLANILSAVDMRLKTLALDGTVLHARMVTPIISTDPAASPYTENIKVAVGNEVRVSAPILLQKFAEWVQDQTNLPSNDHVMLFTSYDLVPNEDVTVTLTTITQGLANVGALCTNSSVSLIEDKGAYQSENVAAHELGHGLGSKHDGEDNTCKPTDRYMMSPGTFKQTDANLLHPWLFSTCSSTAIFNYIKSLEQDTSALRNCLQQTSGQTVSPDLSLTAQAVCERYNGNTSFPCAYNSDFSEICTQLRCRTIESAICTLVVPPTGTCCGTAKSCQAGNCEAGAPGTCPTDDECPLGDQPSIQINNDPAITCSQMNTAFCYSEDLRKACCVTCRSIKTDDTNCTYGDRADCANIKSVLQCDSDSHPPPLPPDCTYGDRADCANIKSVLQYCTYGDRADCANIKSVLQCDSDSDLSFKCCGTCKRLRNPQTTSATTPVPTTTSAITTAEAAKTTTAKPTDPETSPSNPNTASSQTTESTAMETSPKTESTATTTKTSTTTTTTTTTEKDSGRVYGYKPDGFEGCYLPPCSAERPALLYTLVIVCLSIGHLLSANSS
ncbi:hypothetical protein RRG08_007821 [Elysia crispata]|uniref:Peptidase M12B domain-containing protein n=1 Tax=Elysia crispata TaxID=231223 RepID=A0AAE1AE74_9GAST|nr:hypothetical protein RRG08_007821 [Elysia crispata]